MANCVKQRYQPPSVTVVTLPPQEIEFVLRLSEDEASVLKQVINQIGGDPKGLRGVLDEIGAALRTAGVKQTTHKMKIYHGLDDFAYLRIEKGDA